jgi:uncharacterized protein YjbI with pentapeptide repeats
VGANFTNASLLGADLTQAGLAAAITTGTIFTGATWNNTECPNDVVTSTGC